LGAAGAAGAAVTSQPGRRAAEMGPAGPGAASSWISRSIPRRFSGQAARSRASAASGSKASGCAGSQLALGQLAAERRTVDRHQPPLPPAQAVQLGRDVLLAPRRCDDQGVAGRRAL